MWLIKAIVIFIIILFAVYRVCQMTSNTNVKLELIYLVEVVVSIAISVILYKI